MALDFPSSPSVGQQYPSTPIAGVPVYKWNGYAWSTLSGGSVTGKTPIFADGSNAMTAQLTLVGNPVSANDAARKAYVDAQIAGAAYQPFNAQLFAGIPQVGPSFPYTLVATDAQKHIIGTGTVTIPSNASVPFPIGTCVTFVASGGAMTIPITADTMYWYNGTTATSGTRTLANAGVATAIKVASNAWFISGNGLS